MAAEDEVFVMKLDGDPGDFHCMACLKICNYLDQIYCCAKTCNMPGQQQRCEGAFLKVCLQRHAIDEMVTAMLADKKIVDMKGNCLFCRNKKHHEELKWCAGKTKLELFLHVIDREDWKIDTLLEKYFEIRVQNRMNDLRKVQARIEREMRAVAEAHGKQPAEIEHMMAKQGRSARRIQRREVDHIETENEGIRRRLGVKLLKKKNQTIQRIKDACEAAPIPEMVCTQMNLQKLNVN
ncbi:hypothetical protein GCK72_025799 [Caenorhabditis remanei]|uniref:Uncharacterized protein n=1 Tax=Caenorhabditis remanei TaxID=31234 RepID=A0A6A5G3Q5_CAERE|nr:hypothetical protein GCK72_025799 [Caenorhabditis remanei]KAF1749332.1 hypothetical protein GCK72_025799 [Caenorhabditis remanei]